MKDWIAPDYLLTSRRFAEENYEYPTRGKSLAGASVTVQNDHMKIECLRIDPAGRYGVLLGLAGTMMATANGVGTQPVLRGVCVLENILGMPPPPVPQNVPALAPDTQGTTTPRELLSAQWLVANIDLVSECPAEKLMIYATGRVPSYSEQVEMKAIVERVTGDGGGFPDLLIALIESKTFRTR